MAGDPLSTLALSVPELFKSMVGVNQLIKAGGINPVRPTMKVPQGVNEAVNTARSQYFNPRVPEEDYITGRIGANAAHSINAARESGRTPAEILATAAGAEDNQNEALLNLAMEGMKNRNMSANSLEGQLDNEGVWQDRADDYNQRQPYAEESAAKSALIQGGDTNIYGGLAGIGKAIAGTNNKSTTDINSAMQANPYLSTPTSPNKTSTINSTDSAIPGMGGIDNTSLLKLMFG